MTSTLSRGTDFKEIKNNIKFLKMNNLKIYLYCISTISKLNFSDTPDDCSMLCTYMKRFFE